MCTIFHHLRVCCVDSVCGVSIELDLTIFLMNGVEGGGDLIASHRVAPVCSLPYLHKISKLIFIKF